MYKLLLSKIRMCTYCAVKSKKASLGDFLQDHPCSHDGHREHTRLMSLEHQCDISKFIQIVAQETLGGRTEKTTSRAEWLTSLAQASAIPKANPGNYNIP